MVPGSQTLQKKKKTKQKLISSITEFWPLQLNKCDRQTNKSEKPPEGTENIQILKKII